MPQAIHEHILYSCNVLQFINAFALLYIVHASDSDFTSFSFYNLNALFTCVHIEEVIRKDKVGVGRVYLNALGVGGCLYDDLVTVKIYLELRINEVEVLGRGEEDGTLGDDLGINNKLIGEIVVSDVGLLVIYLVKMGDGVWLDVDGISKA